MDGMIGVKNESAANGASFNVKKEKKRFSL